MPQSKVHKVRLQKFLASAGIASRRKAELLITSGRVSVNGEVVTRLGTSIDPGKDKVTLDGARVKPSERELYIFYKPANVVTSMKDPQDRPCVGDYVKEFASRVFPVGRLDFDVTGLLLLTNDGDFAEKLLHPRYGTERVYWAVVKGELNIARKQRLLKGVQLEDGRAVAKRVRVLKPSNEISRTLGTISNGESVLEIVVTEGRKHFVKNILYVVGLPVRKLCRRQFGPYSLGKLRPGEITKAKFL